MTDKQKNAVKKFLFGVKSAVMAMDVSILTDEQLGEVYSGFKELSESLNDEEKEASDEKKEE